MLLAHEIHGTADATPVVLIHGITESRRMWDPVLDDLGASFHLLAVDLRGHGSSDVVGPYDPVTYASDVIETMAATGFAGANVIGHSLGGIVAAAVGSLGGAASVIDIDQSLQLAAAKELVMPIEAMLRGDEATFGATIDAIFDVMYGPLAPGEVARLAALRNARQDVVVGTWAQLFESTSEQLDATVAQLAATITVPFLALHGSDPGDGYASWLTALVPSASVEVWDDHGHYLHLVDPSRFVARAREFIAA